MSYTESFLPGVVRGISYGLFRPPDGFVDEARTIGAGLIRAYIYWAQVEPEPGRYEWDTVDALLDQLHGDEEVWLTVCSSSLWATREATNFLPPSPAKSLPAYGEFVRRLVTHCAGRVTYWQCDNEPSNTGLLWAGTAEEYVAQLKTMHAAVTAADPDARVVLGGCGYDVFSSAPASPQRQFFDHLAEHGRDAFDVFDIHLYGDPLRVPEYVETARDFMRAHGYEKPIVAGEQGGPVLFEFPELDEIVQRVFVAAFTDAPATQSTDELVAQAGQDTPERRAMLALYRQMDQLPPRLQMLMDGARPSELADASGITVGCPPELAAKRHRINCRQLVVRTVLALEAGLRRTAYWNLAPEVAGWHDPYQMMHLLFGKLVLLDYVDGRLSRRYPAADTFQLVADQLRGTTSVSRVDGAAQAFRVERAGADPLLVAWDARDPFDGEDEPPVDVTLPWDAPAATAIDAFGAPVKSTVDSGRVALSLSDTPVFIQTAGA